MSLRSLGERRRGGRVHGVFYLLHPGPSVLVTLTFVAVTSLALRGVPGPGRMLQLVGLMLPLQFAIGVLNDVCDVQEDAVAKPYRPLVRGAVSRRNAAVLGVGLIVLGLADAATLGVPVLVFAAGGCAAGVAYDAGLRRTPLSLLPWWGGMLMLPLAAFAVAGRVDAGVVPALPLALLIATSLHCANAYPDIDADRAAGIESFPALLGRRSAWVMMLASGVATAVLGTTVWRPADAGVALWTATGALGVALLAVAALRLQRPFPLLAVATAVFAIAWIAGLALN
ncbi:MAG: UbiA prenyltransferase family protein [Candidatus Dormibacteraeota bacterium]|nr:UbiA prenyltransferase family protein [Candidatus Dormibacteraeota bacterium]